MTKNYGITFLAFGEEHINELNETVSFLLDFDNHLDIFVVTDNQNLIKNKNLHIREINEPFNFNLKRKSFEFAFEYHNIVVFMDTDVFFVTKPNFNFLNKIKEGMYVRWKSNEVEYMHKKITTEDILETEYGKKINDKNIEFINEFLMVLRIDSLDKRKNFIKTWDELNRITLNVQPNNGAMEGLIIYATCNKLNIEVIKSTDNFFRNILNIGSLIQNNRKSKKTII